MDKVTSTKILTEFNKCVNEQVLSLLVKICEKKNLNYVEVVEELGLTNEPKVNDYKPKSKRLLKLPPANLRCEAIISEGDQCKRSKKDGTCFCRRHKYKQQYGTIHSVKREDTICQLVQEEEVQTQHDELEIEYNGNIITLENGMEIDH